jgi:hypothetical protein
MDNEKCVKLSDVIDVINVTGLKIVENLRSKFK